MSIASNDDLTGMMQASEAVGKTLKAMREYAKPGMSTLELDEFGAAILDAFGARPAPKISYGFPGCACISVNHAVAHGIPAAHIILQEGDLVNIDVSAELNGFFADNGGSFVLGQDFQHLNPLVESSKNALRKALQQIRHGVKIAEVGRTIAKSAQKDGFTVIKNLLGHGIGRSLHEPPHGIPCFYDRFNRGKFQKNAVVAVETFISTRANYAIDTGDGWTLSTADGSFVAQHEHTIVVTDKEPIILTASNGIWD
ncbi:type I methionyl aminopeptidase [Chitinophaga defluvii]|uniref:Methionine aminopeptidase n=1 Tax=Chitinophaga defluvii TaxID=3163343 RepID=A0ABV2T8B2_9BACT